MRKWKETITRTYSVLVALLILVSLTGFIDKGKTVTVIEDGKSREIYTRSLNKDALTRELGLSFDTEAYGRVCSHCSSGRSRNAGL